MRASKVQQTQNYSSKESIVARYEQKRNNKTHGKTSPGPRRPQRCIEVKGNRSPKLKRIFTHHIGHSKPTNVRLLGSRIACRGNFRYRQTHGDVIHQYEKR
jgi:hypothetical protein